MYKVTMQHNKSDSEQIMVTMKNKEDAKKRYIDSSRSDYFSLLEEYKNGRWERLIFQIGYGDVEEELNYVLGQ